MYVAHSEGRGSVNTSGLEKRSPFQDANEGRWTGRPCSILCNNIAIEGGSFVGRTRRTFSQFYDKKSVLVSYFAW